MAGLANFFFIMNSRVWEGGRRERRGGRGEGGGSAAIMTCPIEKVVDIDGKYQCLQGSYAKVTGCHCAIPLCTSGKCGK